MMTAAAILAATAEAFKMPPAVIAGGGRKRVVVLARSAAALVIRRQLPDRSLPRIAQALGASDHSSAIYWIRSAEQREATDQAFRDRVARVAVLAAAYAERGTVPVEALPAPVDTEAAEEAVEEVNDEGFDGGEIAHRRDTITGSAKLLAAIERERAAA